MNYKRDLVDYVSHITPLEERHGDTGLYYVGLCPLHDDSNPSFIVYPNESTQKSVCLCFSCSPKPMDIIDFVQAYLGVNYEEAVKVACSEYPVGSQVTDLLEKKLTQVKQNEYISYSLRIKELYKRYAFETANAVASLMDAYAHANDYWMIDRLCKLYQI